MYKTAVRWMIRRGVAALTRGDTAPLLARYADDAVLVFPGRTSWAGRYEGKDAIGGFLRRFADQGLAGQVHDIVVNGPPWRTTACVLFTATARSPEGSTVYDNRAVLFIRVRWGRITYQEDFEDTQKGADFDRYLAEGGALASAASRTPGT